MRCKSCDTEHSFPCCPTCGHPASGVKREFDRPGKAPQEVCRDPHCDKPVTPGTRTCEEHARLYQHIDKKRQGHIELYGNGQHSGTLLTKCSHVNAFGQCKRPAELPLSEPDLCEFHHWFTTFRGTRGDITEAQAWEEWKFFEDITRRYIAYRANLIKSAHEVHRTERDLIMLEGIKVFLDDEENAKWAALMLVVRDCHPSCSQRGTVHTMASCLLEESRYWFQKHERIQALKAAVDQHGSAGNLKLVEALSDEQAEHGPHDAAASGLSTPGPERSPGPSGEATPSP